MTKLNFLVFTLHILISKIYLSRAMSNHYDIKPQGWVCWRVEILIISLVNVDLDCKS